MCFFYYVYKYKNKERKDLYLNLDSCLTPIDITRQNICSQSLASASDLADK